MLAELPPFGELGVDPASLVVAGTGSLDDDGAAAFDYTVPGQPSLVGEELFWQALIGDPERLSNVERIVLTDL